MKQTPCETSPSLILYLIQALRVRPGNHGPMVSACQISLAVLHPPCWYILRVHPCPLFLFAAACGNKTEVAFFRDGGDRSGGRTVSIPQVRCEVSETKPLVSNVVNTLDTEYEWDQWLVLK